MTTAALATELARTVRGEVRFDAGSRALYATDASNYRQVPLGVVFPQDADDVAAVVATARGFQAPVLPRGGGTSLAGQCCNVAVVLDFSRSMHRVLALDPGGRRARVEPGIVLDRLREAAASHGLTFGPDPSTHNHCTLGGMIGNNSCGVHSVLTEFYGPGSRTSDNLESLEVLTYDGLRLRVGATSDAEVDAIVAAGGRRGDIYRRLRALRDRYADEIRRRFPMIPRRVSGYDLTALLPEHGFNVARALAGSEGTCVTILEATVTLVPSPPVRSLLVLGYPSVYEAGDHVPEIRRHRPIGLEGMDDRLVNDMIKKHLHPQDVKLLPDGRGWLLVEFGGDTKDEADAQARALMSALRAAGRPPTMKLFDDPAEEHVIWTVRESGLGATARVPGEKDTWEGWEDSSVPPERLGAYLRDLRALFDRHGYACALYGHFGQGCVHTRIDFDLVTADGIRRFRAFLDAAADLVLSHGGSLSGEHGDGQSRAELLGKMYGPTLLQAFREFKAIWDPEGRMNPGKIVEPYRITDNLRLGIGYAPPRWPTHFKFPDDEGGLARATVRCVGVGECRREHGGVMCPSYRVTHEERHSTRGRAHLLWEMLQGEVVRGGWRDAHVREALDLCLACKGCKSDCPMNVDMATYKAEFLSHYYAGRLRPRAAYAMGLIHWWARAAARVPGLVNALASAPVLGAALKRAAGIAPARRLPAFAPATFSRWFRRRPPRTGGRRVILWPDTFNDHFFPRTARNAVQVLEAAGCRVTLPPPGLCCGRPLYDWGMLTLARRQLREILDAMRADIRAGVPVIVLEPSCAAVFRDELLGLFPDDEDARRLARQTLLLGEFLARHAPADGFPTMSGRTLVQTHCHQHAVLGRDADREILQRCGLDVEVLDGGCCGMAGSFGFEADKYDVSIAVGEHAVLPAVRAAAPDTLIVADGFSCREQIVHGTGRRAWHLADVLGAALGDAQATQTIAVDGHRPHRIALPAAAVTAAVVAGVGLAAAMATHRRSLTRRR